MDYYNSIEECNTIVRKNLNPKYKYFNQQHFTAGDQEQFNEKSEFSGDFIKKNVDTSHNLFLDTNVNIWSKFLDRTPVSKQNMFMYLFYKFKKGIYIRIRNNTVEEFLPFSNFHFINEWSRLVKTQSYPKSLIETLSKIDNIPINKINGIPERWYANNCLIRYEFPQREEDTSVANMRDMFIELCKHRKVQDIEFFINRRDFPLITRDETEAYTSLFGENVKVLSHNYNTYSPLVSMVTTDNNADLPIPTAEDWARVSMRENKYFKKYCTRKFDDLFETKWNDRIPIAVFRGSSTGCGVTIDTNIRLKLAYISSKKPKRDNNLILDAGITKWSLRPRLIDGQFYVQNVSQFKKNGIDLVNTLSPLEQSKYKYLINVDGHVSAFRLSLELGMGSCILLAKSKYKMWFHSELKEYVHYIPVNEDLSDLIDQINWCIDNDSKCETIAQNAKLFYDTYLQKDGIFDYLQILIEKMFSSYGYFQPYKILPTVERYFIETSQYNKISQKVVLNTIPNSRRYDVITAIRLAIAKESSQLVFSDNVCSFGNYKMIATKNDIHSACIGLNCINKLIESIPNFAYTFGYYNEYCLTEFLEGISFQKFMSQSTFTFNKYVLILFQLALALQMAQNACSFVHCDLSPENVIIQEFKTERIISYVIDGKTVVNIKTTVIPIITNYSNASAIVNNVIVSKHNMFYPGYDMFTIMFSLTSIHENMKNNQQLFTVLANKFIFEAYYNVKNLNFYESLQFLKIRNNPSVMYIYSKYWEKSPLESCLDIKSIYGAAYVPLFIEKTLKPQPVYSVLLTYYKLFSGLSLDVMYNKLFDELDHSIKLIGMVPDQIQIYYIGQKVIGMLMCIRNDIVKNGLDPKKYIDLIQMLSTFYEADINDLHYKNPKYYLSEPKMYDLMVYSFPESVNKICDEKTHCSISSLLQLSNSVLLYTGIFEMPQEKKLSLLQTIEPLYKNTMILLQSTSTVSTVKLLTEQPELEPEVQFDMSESLLIPEYSF